MARSSEGGIQLRRDDRGRGGGTSLRRLQKQGLLSGPTPNKRVHHNQSPADPGLSPGVKTRGGPKNVPGVQPTQEVALAKLAGRDVEDERGQSVELVLVQRGEDERRESLLHGLQIELEQILSVGFGDPDALAGRTDVTIADHPSAIRQPNRSGGEPLETPDEVKAVTGSVQARRHACDPI